MKCKDCDCRSYKGFFESKPDAYVCLGVKEPFIIDDIDAECTEYPEKNKDAVISVIKVDTIAPVGPVTAYVNDDGIYVSNDVDLRYYKMLISKELFVEAYNKWIKGVENGQSN